MENLQQIRENYERVYGRTCPVAEFSMLQPKQVYDILEYKGCSLSGDEITFMFAAPLPTTVNDLIEMQFRNRLSRKIAFMTDDCKLTVFISDNPEERGEYLTSAMILDTYFRREKPSARTIAEYRVFSAGKDWRNPALVEQELKKIYESNQYLS